MSNGQPTERRSRSISTTFDLKDVAVVAIAAFTAAGPFFAYDTRISVAETKIEQMEQVAVDNRQLIKELMDEHDVLTKQYEDLIAQENEEHYHVQPDTPPRK